MSPAIATLLAFVAYILAYRIYSARLAAQVFRLDSDRVTPAYRYQDGVDYEPTRPAILFGHHFASITGLAPMLGPAIAVIWGWAPALIWVLCGSIFIGCVHDFSALILSVRGRGLSVGTLAAGEISPQAKRLFLLLIFFGVSLAMGVFVFIIAKLFGLYLVPPNAANPGLEGYPQAVFPSLALMLIALVSGWLLKRREAPLAPIISVGFILSLLSIWAGLWLKERGIYDPSWWPSGASWSLILLAYAFAASVLPVWTLLQPRDFLNSLLLYLGLGLAYLGFFIAQPGFNAPAFVPNPEGAPPMLPFVFIMIACGAASGFHGLVSSGTSSKQLAHEGDARPIGYGGMIGESLLGLLAVLACTAGFASPAEWHNHYASFESAKGLASKLAGFIEGTSSFLSALGLPSALAGALIAMVVVSFALTTLDSATRLLRFNIEELFGGICPPLKNRYLSSLAACASIALFAFYEVNGKPAALALWGLFGTTNQLLAALTLSLATLYLKRRGAPIWYTGIPALFMMGSTIISMSLNLWHFAQGAGDLLLLSVGSALLILGLWVMVSLALALRRPAIGWYPEILGLEEEPEA